MITYLQPLLRIILLSLLLIQFSTVRSQHGNTKDQVASDINRESPAKYDWEGRKQFRNYTMDSYYLVMRDDVRIAMDVYLPKTGKRHAGKFPTILHQWRYWRAIQLKWPYCWLKKQPIGPLEDFMKAMLANGYALVSVDSRGSGASEGCRPYPWTQEERDDMTEIVDHIVEQDWSNGIVGAAGASYSGTTSEFLLIQQHPAVKAVINMYSLFDVYTDNAFTGGIHNEWFTSVWGDANEALDRNELPNNAGKLKKVVKGVLPVKREYGGEKAGTVFREAQKDHCYNLNVNDDARTLAFRDQPPDSRAVTTMDEFSPHTYWREQDASGAAVYCWSGWFDGAYQNGAIKRYLTLTNPENRLIIGPWEHGGSFNCDWTAPGRSGFDHIGETLRFFDHHLKGWDTGISNEKPVHYYTMVEQRWKSNDTWPPDNSTYKPVFLEADSTLVWRNGYSSHRAEKASLKAVGDSLNHLKSIGMKDLQKQSDRNEPLTRTEKAELKEYLSMQERFARNLAKLNESAQKVKIWRESEGGKDVYRADTTTGMGPYTRFRSVAGQLHTPYVYPDRNARDSLLLTYDSEPLPQDVEVTGHPLVHIYLSSSTDDAQVFVYLEDVDKDGKVHYVTEGELRALHRRVRNDKAPYVKVGPYFSFEREDAEPLIPGEVAELRFSMLPTSYLFRKGHRVRIAIAGADTDQFRNMTNDEPEYTFYRSFKYPSRVELPVVN